MKLNWFIFVGMGNALRINRVENDIQLSIDIDELSHIALSNPETPCKVIDKDKFADAVVGLLQSYQTQNNQETGLTHAEQLFDDILLQVQELGFDCVEIIELT